jgi:two-component system, OmpR family, response regulator
MLWNLDMNPKTHAVSPPGKVGQPHFSMRPRDSRTGPQILVIDDHFGDSPDLRRLLQEDGIGVDVLTHVNFPVSPEMFDRYQAVIVDVMTPQSRGFDGLRDIRKNTELPVLVLTTRGSEEDRLAGFESGADDYVVKPCRPREVVARIRALLRRHLLGR